MKEDSPDSPCSETEKTGFISLPVYFRTYADRFPNELTEQVRRNAIKLLMAVNDMLWDVQEHYGFNSDEIVMTSGWRPLGANLKIGGAQRSTHIEGLGIDFAGVELAKLLMTHHELLKKHDLWLENPRYTASNNHTHIDSRYRDDRKIRVFTP